MKHQEGSHWELCLSPERGDEEAGGISLGIPERGDEATGGISVGIVLVPQEAS